MVAFIPEILTNYKERKKQEKNANIY